MGWFSKGKVEYVNVSKFSAAFPDQKLRSMWFFELCSTNGSVWTIDTYKDEETCIERAETFGKIFGFKVKRFGKLIKKDKPCKRCDHYHRKGGICDLIELPKGRARRQHAS